MPIVSMRAATMYSALCLDDLKSVRRYKLGSLVFLVGNVNVSGTTHVSGSVSGLGSVGARSLVVPGSRTGANVCNLTAFVGVGKIVKPDALVERKRSTSNVDIAENLFCGMRTLVSTSDSFI